MPSHVHMRFSSMVYPLAWQALIDRLLAGRKIRRGGKVPLFLKSRMAWRPSDGGALHGVS
jgi:hypothetical protein